MLARDQIDHFKTFGFLVCRQVFSSEEVYHIIEEADALYSSASARSGEPDGVIWETDFVEQNPELLKLIEDDRIYLAMQDLIGKEFYYLGSEGMRGLNRRGPVHHWHADGEWSLDKLNFLRIKIMLYLDPLNGDSGALRIIPGSHRLPFHEALRPFQEAHMHDEPTFFGLKGADVPAHVVETTPGDMVIFNQWLFHAVYGNCGRRRNIVLKFADRATTEVELGVLKRSPEVFNPHEALRNSRSPRIQHMTGGLVALGDRVTHADE